jgi:glyoxylase-like metal-dependent hydrolase (beta-lactamase superfamily II)
MRSTLHTTTLHHIAACIVVVVSALTLKFTALYTHAVCVCKLLTRSPLAICVYCVCKTCAGCIEQALLRPPLIFRQLFEAESSTYTYILADPITKDAVIIDPVDTTALRDSEIVTEMGLNLKLGLNTHVHADHVTGTGLLKKQYKPEMRSAIGAVAGAVADVPLQHGDTVTFGGRFLTCRSTPGHTQACISFVLDDKSAVFSGDALLIRGCGR